MHDPRSAPGIELDLIDPVSYDLLDGIGALPRTNELLGHSYTLLLSEYPNSRAYGERRVPGINVVTPLLENCRLT